MTIKKILLALSLLIYTQMISAQVCTYSNLSERFLFKIECQKLTDTADVPSAKITVNILEKRGRKLTQTISINGGFLFDDVFKSDTACRSYITNYHKNLMVADYDFGDIVIADVNFDGKEDIAIKYDSGGNGGPMYKFYLQNNMGKFIIDTYLSDKMGLFPFYIDKRRKRLTTCTHANVYQEGRSIYQYYPSTKSWKRIKKFEVNI